MANKAAKAQKPSKTAKKAARAGLQDIKYSAPFKDMALYTFVLVTFCVWRLYAAVSGQHLESEAAWTVITAGVMAVINIWTFILVMVMAKRGGDLDVVELHDNDIFRFTALSGLVGAWLAVILFRYRSGTPLFYTRLMGRSVFSLAWAALFVKYYMRV